MKLIHLTIEEHLSSSVQKSKIIIRAFTKLEDAQTYLEEQVQDFKRLELNYDVVVERPYYYHAYDDGLDFTSRNSTEFYIKTIPLDDGGKING